MLQIATDPAPPPALSHVWGIDGSFYFKPEPGGRLWFSPHDEIATDPCDAQPEEIDVPIAIDRLEQVVDWAVAALEREWAGRGRFGATGKTAGGERGWKEVEGPGGDR